MSRPQRRLTSVRTRQVTPVRIVLQCGGITPRSVVVGVFVLALFLGAYAAEVWGDILRDLMVVGSYVWVVALVCGLLFFGFLVGLWVWEALIDAVVVTVEQGILTIRRGSVIQSRCSVFDGRECFVGIVDGAGPIQPPRPMLPEVALVAGAQTGECFVVIDAPTDACARDQFAQDMARLLGCAVRR